MQIFLEIILQLSSFAVNIFLPLSVGLVVVGLALSHKSILKSAFFSGIAVVALYAIIFGMQLYQVASSGTALGEVFKSSDSLTAIGFTFLLPMIVGAVVAVLANRRFKKVA